jgi:hypothetical protein
MSLLLDDDVRKEWDSLRSRGNTGTRAAAAAGPASIRDSDRSFVAVATTETPARMIDWERMAYIDEVLLAAGGSVPGDHVPLLRNHRRYEPADDIYGSAREWKLEADLNQWACRCFMSDPSDPEDPVVRAWTRVRGGHLRGVSIGYEVLAFEDVPPGEKKKVAGRFWTAGQRVLRVSTEWVVHELSLTPIGADKKALVRSKGGDGIPVFTGFRTSQPELPRSFFR